MEHPRTQDFADARAKSISMMTAVKLARTEIRAMSSAPIDAISRCEQKADGGWLVALDLIESPARLGENDLLARFELHLAGDGSVTGIERTGRYRREDDNRP
jgi:hypothetical protein